MMEISGIAVEAILQIEVSGTVAEFDHI